MWWNKKKSADHALKELVDGFSAAIGPKLISVLIYGSKASGEFHEGRSDVNVFILLEDATWETLHRMAKPVRIWLKNGHPAPVFVPKNELQIYADSLPIEFLDMQDHHKIIFGPDPIQDLKVDRTNLRAQCEMELSVKQLKLRQAVLLADGNAKHLRDILTASLPSVFALYRAVLRLEMDVPKGDKAAAVEELARRVGFDGDSLKGLWDFHMRRQTDNVEDLTKHYLDGIERVLAYASRK